MLTGLMQVNNKFKLGDLVQLNREKIDELSDVGMVVRILIEPHGLMYAVSWGSYDKIHYDMELVLFATQDDDRVIT